jgi:hypothetical protein
VDSAVDLFLRRVEFPRSSGTTTDSPHTEVGPPTPHSHGPAPPGPVPPGPHQIEYISWGPEAFPPKNNQNHYKSGKVSQVSTAGSTTVVTHVTGPLRDGMSSVDRSSALMDYFSVAVACPFSVEQLAQFLLDLAQDEFPRGLAP